MPTLSSGTRLLKFIEYRYSMHRVPVLDGQRPSSFQLLFEFLVDVCLKCTALEMSNEFIILIFV